MMRHGWPRGLSAPLAAIAMLGACAAPAPRIGAPPAALKLDPFYARSLDAGGIPVSSSAAVSDAALLTARSIVDQMLARRPDLRRSMIAHGQRVVVMAQTEGTTDLPEQRDWTKPALDDPRLTVCERKHYAEWIGSKTDREYWNDRARGMGGILTSAAEENLLAVPGTRYFGENIFVHEFSHAILETVETADRPLYAAVERAYDHARANGLWHGEYGEATVQEYWAEGTQFWFESNKLVVADGRNILSASDLATYDPMLAAVLRQVYGDRHHLAADRFWRSPARIPVGGPPTSTAAVC